MYQELWLPNNRSVVRLVDSNDLNSSTLFKTSFIKLAYINLIYFSLTQHFGTDFGHLLKIIIFSYLVYLAFFNHQKTYCTTYIIEKSVT